MQPTNEWVIVLPAKDRDGEPTAVDTVLSRIEVTEAGALRCYRPWFAPGQDEPGEDLYLLYAPGQWLRAERKWASA